MLFEEQHPFENEPHFSERNCEIISNFTSSEKPELLDSVCQFRLRVWEEEGYPAEGNPDRLTDQLDNDSFHWAVTLDGEVVAAFRLSICRSLKELSDEFWHKGLNHFPVDGPIAYLSRGVVSKEHRGHGISTAFINERMRIAVKVHDAKTAILAAPHMRFEYFTALGFQTVMNSSISPIHPDVLVTPVAKSLAE